MRTRIIRNASLALATTLVLGSGAIYWFGTARTQNISPAWPARKAFVYAIESREEGLDMPEAVFGRAGAVQRYDLTVSTRARATVLDASPDGATVAWSFDTHRASYRTGGRNDAAYSKAIENDLNGTYVSRSDARGRVVGFLAPPQTSSLGAGYVRALIGTLEVTKPASAHDFGQSWTAQEPDADGLRSSSYTLSFWLDNPVTLPTARFVRSSTNIRPAQRPGRPTVDVIVKRYDQGLLRDDGVVSELVANERRAVHLGANRLATSAIATVATLVEISDVPNVRAPAGLDERLASAPGLHFERSESDLRDRTLREAASKQTLAQILARIRPNPKQMNGTAVVSDLAAEFYVRPHSVERVRPLLERGLPQSTTFECVRLGLQNASSQAAQRLLAQTLLARAKEPAAEELAESLARVAQPNAESIAALERLARISPAKTQIAELSLGTAASRLAQTSPDRARTIVASLASKLRAARTEGDRQGLLLALGNAGTPDTLPAVLGALHDPDGNVRAEVATALRSIQSEDADAALRGLLRDRWDGVRINAATAYGSRPLSSADVASLARAAQGDSNRDVRIAATSALASVPEPSDDDESRLRALASDPDKNVRKTASEGLQHLEAIRAAESV